MEQVIAELSSDIIPRGYVAVYVSDYWRKSKGKKEAQGAVLGGQFMPIGFELFARLRKHFDPVDVIAVNRKNAKLDKGNWRKAAIEQDFYLRGFNYLFIMKKP